MSRLDINLLIKYFGVYFILQIPLLHKFVLFDTAYGFFYLGLLLLMPYGLNPFLRIFSGFFIGLVIDIFSSTPGIHASACTLVMYGRDYLLRLVIEDVEENPNLSIFNLKLQGTLAYLLPLIFIHHSAIFFIEHGKWEGFWMVFERVLASTLFSLTFILLFNLLLAKRIRRI